MLAAAIQRFTERSPTPNTSGACVWLMPTSTALTTRWRNCACALAVIFFIGVSSIYPLTHHAIFCCRSNNYGPGGVNGINHLAAELLKRMGGFDITLIPYKGVAQALPAVIAGEVQLMFGSLPGSIDQIRAGRIRAIAVTSAKRSNAAPDIPTVAESGVPGYDAPSWWGFLAPAGTPKAIIARLNADTLKALRTRDVHDLLTRQGMDPAGSTPAEFEAYLRAEIAKWTNVVRDAGIKAN